MGSWQIFFVEMAKALAWPGTVAFLGMLLVWNIDLNHFLRNARIQLKRGTLEVEIQPAIRDIPRETEILEERTPRRR
jgi:hypothetical protein